MERNKRRNNFDVWQVLLATLLLATLANVCETAELRLENEDCIQHDCTVRLNLSFGREWHDLYIQKHYVRERFEYKIL